MDNKININKIKKIKVNKDNKKNKPKIKKKIQHVGIKSAIIPIKKIDFVITHVDSTNEEWQKLFENYKLEKNPTLKSKTKNRFRNNDELKYCLRAIDKYTNFYRNIYIILNHSPPSWLNINHPQIKIIYHHEIEDLKDNLPTFNSQAIECNLHKIPDITDEFLYFNDDFFINTHLNYDFFKQDKINVYLGNYLSPKGTPKQGISGFHNAWINSNKILDTHYKKEMRFTIEHCPYFVDKKIISELEIKFKEYFANTTKSKFRELNDINPLCSLLQYHYVYKDRGVFVKNGECRTIYFRDNLEENIIRIEKLNNSKIKIFCIEDNMLEDKQENINLIKNFLLKKYPNKSKFEL